MKAAGAVVSALVLVLVLVLGPAPGMAKSPVSVPSTFVVGLEHDTRATDLARLVAAGASAAIPVTTIDAVVVKASRRDADAIARWDDVAYVEPDAPVRFANYQTAEQTGEGAVRQGRPPLPQAFDGAGVTIAVVDTGVATTHPDLSGKVIDHLHFDALALSGDLLSEAERDTLVQTIPSPQSEAATHGMSVAAVLTGSGQVAMGGIDMRGVATGSRIVDFSTCCLHDVEIAAGAVEAAASTMVLAYDYMIRHRADPEYPGGIRIATNQWGYDPADMGPRTALAAVLRATIAAGITVVFAAGNYGPGENTVWPPARDVPELIVAAVSCPAIDGGEELLNGGSCGQGELASYSSAGPAIDVAAPVSGIWAPRYLSSAASQGEAAIPPPGESDPVATAHNRIWYGKFGGTSAAAPYTSAVIALMLQANPALRPADVAAILTRTAHDYGAPGWDRGWGWGEVRALAAVQGALGARFVPRVAAVSPPPTDVLPATGRVAPASALALLVAAFAVARSRRWLGDQAQRGSS